LYGTRDVVVLEDPGMEASPAYSRDFDTFRYAGGARIFVPASGTDINSDAYTCTAGFAWQMGTVQYMLTAGHCVPNGGKVWIPQPNVNDKPLQIGWVPTDGSMDTWAVGTGTVALSGQTALRGDLAMVQMTGGAGMVAKMYRGGPTSSQVSIVSEMWNRPSSIGDQFCTGGAVSGEICGWTVEEIHTDISYGSEGYVRHATKAYKIGDGTIGGDSGGPVYTVRSDGNIVAKGIISGKQIYNDPVTNKAHMYFTDIWQAFDAFSGGLLDVTAPTDPFGNLESATGEVSTVSVSGWAVDPDQPQTSLDVYLYIGGPVGQGEFHDIGLANLGRSDVAGALDNWEAGPYHGFSATIATSLSGSQPIYVYIANAPGSSGKNSLLWSGVVTITPLAPTLPMLRFTLGADMTGDYRGEILAVDSGGRLLLYAGTPTGQLSSPVSLWTSGFGQTRVFGPGDVDLNGKADVLTIDGNGDLWLYLGNGWDHIFPALKVGNGWTGWQLVPAGDLNGDGKVDLLGVDANGDLFMYAGRGDGTFATKKQVGNGWTGWSLYAAGDLNGDKKMDILGIDPNGDLYQYAGKGDGTFYAKVQAGNGWLGYTLAAGADLTGDGLADIVGRDNSSKVLYFYRGQGNAKFAMKAQIATGW